MTSKARFWRGRIETPEHALMVVRRAAIGFGAFAGLALATQMEDLEAGVLGFLAAVALCALALWFARSVWAARVLIVAFGLLTALMSAIPIYWLLEREPLPYVLLFTPLALIFGIGLFAALRAHAAARVLKHGPAEASGLAG